MSTYGERYQDAIEDEWLSRLYEEHAEQARTEFRQDRLKSYYATHLGIAETAYSVVSDARVLKSVSVSAALIRATTASELGIKDLLLKPIVYGLVHSESLAGAISDLVIGHSAVDRYRDLLVGILKEYGGFDLNTYQRTGSSGFLWGELRQNQVTRNRVVHRGEVPTDTDVSVAIGVAQTILETLFPQVTGRLGFHLHGATLCDDPHVSDEIAKIMARASQ